MVAARQLHPQRSDTPGSGVRRAAPTAPRTNPARDHRKAPRAQKQPTGTCRYRRILAPVHQHVSARRPVQARPHMPALTATPAQFRNRRQAAHVSGWSSTAPKLAAADDGFTHRPTNGTRYTSESVATSGTALRNWSRVKKLHVQAHQLARAPFPLVQQSTGKWRTRTRSCRCRCWCVASRLVPAKCRTNTTPTAAACQWE